MDNPLNRVVPAEDRDDGVYIKVPRDANKPILLRSIRNVLEESLIINYNWKEISGVVERARGAFEKIGPPFEYYDTVFDSYILVEKTPLQGVMRVNSSCIADGNRPTVNILAYCLKRKGVVFGIKLDALQQIISTASYDTSIVVAEGISPVNGEDGKIRYEVEINEDKTPQILADGSVDYRSIKAFIQVAQGQAIARRVPPSAGTPGKSITGDDIPAAPGKEYVLASGNNVLVSEDGNQLVAEKSGIIYDEHGKLHIKEQLEIPKNVDFNVGNIKFSGKVMINGDVLPGFSVESEEDIVIKGEIESASVISRNGTVTIQKGVIGKDETKVYGKKGVHIAFAQNAELATEGQLVVERSCLHCNCTCDTFEAERKDTVVVGGVLTAYSWIKLANAGNDEGVATKISLVDKERSILKEKKAELDDLRKKVSEKMDPIKKQLVTKAAMLKKLGSNVTEKHKTELRKWIDQYNTMKMKFDYVEKKIVDIEKELKKPVQNDGYIKISGTACPGTHLELYGLSRMMKTKMTNKRVLIRNSVMEIEG